MYRAVPEGLTATEDRSGGGISLKWNEKSRFKGVVMVIQSPDATETKNFTLALTRTGFAAIMPPPQQLFTSAYRGVRAKQAARGQAQIAGPGQMQAGYSQHGQGQYQIADQAYGSEQPRIPGAQAYDQYGATTDRYYQSAPVPTLASRPSTGRPQHGTAPMPANRARGGAGYADSPRDYEMPPNKSLKEKKSGWFGRSPTPTQDGSRPGDQKRSDKQEKQRMKAQEKEWAAQKKQAQKNGWPNGAYAVQTQTQRETSGFYDDEKPKRGLFSRK